MPFICLKPWEAKTLPEVLLRTVRPQPDVVCDGVPTRFKTISVIRNGGFVDIDVPEDKPGCKFIDRVPCPYGRPGDVLALKEAFYQSGYRCQSHPEDDEYRCWCHTPCAKTVWYSSDGVPPCTGPHAWGGPQDNEERAKRKRQFFPHHGQNYWRKLSAAQMPPSAVRHHRRITEVRCVRTDRLTEEEFRQAMSGRNAPHCPGCTEGFDCHCVEYTFAQTFEALWQRDYGRRYPWPAWAWWMRTEEA